VATPALPTDPHPSADSARTLPEYLFVQPFEGGTWTPKAGADGAFTLTLTGAAEQTTYFSDRPERDVGLAPTQAFLDGLGFSPDNPPNAAIVAQTEGGEQDVLVVELLAPVYDTDGGTLTYEAKVLADYGGRGLAGLARQQTDYELPESFGAGSLFIDDCPDIIESCFLYVQNSDGTCAYNYVGNQSIGQCWNYDAAQCFPCATSYTLSCQNNFPSICTGDPGGGCYDDMDLCNEPACCAGQGGCACTA
jgi:hypothetical protein